MTFEEWWSTPGPIPDANDLDYERAIFLAGQASGFALGIEAAAKACEENAENIGDRRLKSHCPACHKVDAQDIRALKFEPNKEGGSDL